MKTLLTLLLFIPTLGWGNLIELLCKPKEYKMFDGIIFTENNLTDEDLNTISFIMRINEAMNYIELETSSGFTRKFSIDDEIHKKKINASGTWSGQEYTIVVDNFFNYKIDMKFQELHSFDYGSCKNLDKI